MGVSARTQINRSPIKLPQSITHTPDLTLSTYREHGLIIQWCPKDELAALSWNFQPAQIARVSRFVCVDTAAADGINTERANGANIHINRLQAKKLAKRIAVPLQFVLKDLLTKSDALKTITYFPMATSTEKK